jgi:SAM-dependent methyltransferase
MKRCVRCSAQFAGDSWTCPGCHVEPDVQDGMLMFAPALARETAGYDAALFEAHGGSAAEQSFWTGARSALLVWAMSRYAAGCRRFCEIGCGTGAVLAEFERAFPDMELVGAETLLDGLRAARRKLARTVLMQLDGRDIPFEEEFDAIGAFDVIEHIADDLGVLRSMARALRPGGALLLTVPQHPFLFGPADVSARHVRRYTARGLTAQVEQIGLRVECVTSFVSILFPAMAAIRLLSKWRGGAYDSAEEFKIGPFNQLFARIMSVERWTIRQGLRWPMGGSLLLVARKP